MAIIAQIDGTSVRLRRRGAPGREEREGGGGGIGKKKERNGVELVHALFRPGWPLVHE